MTRLRVLVIDDDPLFRSLLTSILRDDFQVIAAADGAEGYYKALEQPPHLAIVDIRMTGWDGLRTLKAFRSHHALSHIPVMMLTSDASPQTVMSAMQAGASDYIIKTTLSREDFLEKVCRQLHVAAPDRPTTGADNPPGQVAVPSANVRFAPAKIPQTNFDRKAPMALDELLLQPLIDELD